MKERAHTYNTQQTDTHTHARTHTYLEALHQRAVPGHMRLESRLGGDGVADNVLGGYCAAAAADRASVGVGRLCMVVVMVVGRVEVRCRWLVVVLRLLRWLLVGGGW